MSAKVAVIVVSVVGLIGRYDMPSLPTIPTQPVYPYDHDTKRQLVAGLAIKRIAELAGIWLVHNTPQPRKETDVAIISPPTYPFPTLLIVILIFAFAVSEDC
jgi:hypothetical protein